ncbi:putative amino acid transporter [Coniella lustricola]|uniref:Putative amino acid transporter n=1 Tax=Coniella lustricola TaxID=2025994 RepID=A0A2T3A0S6_9PEZI|nr:putative amino acid transporter [Coniella lustricola]
MSNYRAPSKPVLVTSASDDHDALRPGQGSDGSARLDEAQGDFSAMDPTSGVKRGLKTRHLSMMALAGIIGPGLLVGSGGALSSGGPASLLIGFGVIGIVAFSIMQSLGELTTLYPSGGAFTALADRLVDKALGVAVGWNYFIIWVAVLANEYNTVCSILVFWSDKVPLWGYFLLLWFAFLGFQLLGVEAFGEAEFWLALIKLGGLVAFFIFAIVYAAGGIHGVPAIGFQYWHDPGAFATGFRGVATVFVFCSTFYAGCESVAVAATETKNPGVAVPRAIRQVFWRIIFIYMGSAFFFGLTCPSNATGLVSASSKALQSPMTIAIQNAGWYAGVHLINSFILITCLSAVNSSIYIGARTLLFMGQDGKAPKLLGWTDKRGVPIPAIVLTNLCGALSMMNISTGAGQAYEYIVNLSGVSTFLVWGSISFIHIRFRQAWKAQGYTTADLPFVAMWYPWGAYFGLGANLFLALVQGWANFSPFDAGGFVDAYILLPLFPLIYLVYKLVNKTRFWRADEVDLQSGRRRDLDEAKELAHGEVNGAPRPWWATILRSL